METLLVGVVALALVLAVAMGVIAWRVLRRDRAREDARVALLRSWADAPEDVGMALDDTATVLPTPVHPTRTSLPAVVLMTLIGVAAGVGVTYAIYRPSSSPTTPLTRPSLELVALSHIRSDDGTFRVSGVVANPPGGGDATRLVAVVSLFDEDGGYLDTATAPVAFPTVTAGDESPFTVQVPTRTRIARYRLAFREEQGGPVPHVDRRHTRRDVGPSDIEVARQ
jgi:hypothetical protein